jgi:hypothetical protein
MAPQVRHFHKLRTETALHVTDSQYSSVNLSLLSSKSSYVPILCFECWSWPPSQTLGRFSSFMVNGICAPAVSARRVQQSEGIITYHFRQREAIGERTREALRHKGSKRERVGNIGYGFRLAADGVHVEECPQEQAALSEIRRLRNEGRSMRGIATALNTRGYRTRRGSDWRLGLGLRPLQVPA